MGGSGCPPLSHSQHDVDEERNVTKSWTRVLAAAGAAAGLLSGFSLSGFSAALAADGPLGQPHPWQLGLQEGVTPIKHSIADLHSMLLIIITAITVFVLALLLYVMVRFGAKKNPVPSRISHNTFVEIAWTLIPVLILVVIAVPSFRLLYAEDRIPKADMTLKVTGHQWYWSYEYPDNGGFGFDSLMVQTDDLKKGQPRLLETDNHVVVPVDTTVRIQITGADVLHAWMVPALGVQIEAVTGRLNESWFKAEKEGIFYGQCTELCGINHGFMPISVEVVSKEKFKEWAAAAKKKFAADEAPSRQLAQADNR